VLVKKTSFGQVRTLLVSQDGQRGILRVILRNQLVAFHHAEIGPPKGFRSQRDSGGNVEDVRQLRLSDTFRSANQASRPRHPGPRSPRS